MNSEISQKLTERLKALESLNPDWTQKELDELYQLARTAGKDFFPAAAEQVSRLVGLYLHSTVKELGKDIMKEYFFHLDQSAKLLRSSGEIPLALPQASNTFSTALVPAEHTEALDFCKIINRAEVPKELVKAADAYRRRTEVVSGVLEYAFRVLWLIDDSQAEAWLANLFQCHEGNIDPDVARDAMLVVLKTEKSLSPDFHSWLMRFADDQNLLEYWPTVTRLADRLLCNDALRHYFEKTKPRNSLLAQLQFYVRTNNFSEESLLTWNQNALQMLGDSVQNFLTLEKSAIDEKWKTASLLCELNRISDLFVPILITADQILALPDGTEQLAMAFMGLAGKTHEAWENSLLDFSFRAVKRTFLLDFRAGRKPVDSIRKLTFGDDEAFRMATSELDLASQNFDSVKQRDKIANFLSVYYASFRHSQLLGTEIAKRYHNLMRMLHDDFLSQILPQDLLDAFHQRGILQELASIAAEARKYLAKRKANENTLEQMIAAKIAFERAIRKKRSQILA